MKCPPASSNGLATWLAGEQVVAEINRIECGVAFSMHGQPALGDGVLAILLLRPVLRDDEFRLQRDDLVMSGRHQGRCQHAVVIFNLALPSEPGPAVPAMDLARALILGAVERDQHAPVEPAEHVQAAVDVADLIDRLREHRMQQHRRDRVEHVSDVIVTGDLGDTEQARAVGVPMACLELPLMGQEGRALHEEHREGRHADVAHGVGRVDAAALVRKPVQAAS